MAEFVRAEFNGSGDLNSNAPETGTAFASDGDLANFVESGGELTCPSGTAGGQRIYTTTGLPRSGAGFFVEAKVKIANIPLNALVRLIVYSDAWGNGAQVTLSKFSTDPLKANASLIEGNGTVCNLSTIEVDLSTAFNEYHTLRIVISGDRITASFYVNGALFVTFDTGGTPMAAPAQIGVDIVDVLGNHVFVDWFSGLDFG